MMDPKPLVTGGKNKKRKYKMKGRKTRKFRETSSSDNNDDSVGDWEGNETLMIFDYFDDDTIKLMKLIEILLGRDNETLNKIKCDYSKAAGEAKNNNTALIARDVIDLLRRSIIYRQSSMTTKMLELLAIEKQNRDHVLYKAGFHVLENLPKETYETLDVFIRSAMRLPHLNKREIVLDFINHRFRKLNFERPRDLLQALIEIQQRLRTNPTIDMNLKAYVAFYDYLEWKNIQMSGQDRNQEDELRLKNSFIRAINEVLNVPGTWDIFVLKLKEIHEHYSEVEECCQALAKYSKNNPTHLHAKIYFYGFLVKHKLDFPKQLKLLKDIIKLAPMDLHAIEYSRLLKGLKREKALVVMYNFLDYRNNKNNPQAWTVLLEVIQTVLRRPKRRLTEVAREQWMLRSSYWPNYHFNPTLIQLKTEDDAVACAKKCCFLMCITMLEIGYQNPTDLQYLRIGTKLLRKSDWPEVVHDLKSTLKKIERYKMKFIPK